MTRRTLFASILGALAAPFVAKAAKPQNTARIDLASVEIMPPIDYPEGRPSLRWGPGFIVPERSPSDYHYRQ